MSEAADSNTGAASESLYRELILEEYKHPRNKGRLAGATHSFRATNSTCGDEIEILLRIREGQIEDVRFDGTGCAISQAAASLFTEHIKGRRVDEVLAMDEREIVSLFGFSPNPMRMKCAVLPLRATADALMRGALKKGVAEKEHNSSSKKKSKIKGKKSRKKTEKE